MLLLLQEEEQHYKNKLYNLPKIYCLFSEEEGSEIHNPVQQRFLNLHRVKQNTKIFNLSNGSAQIMGDANLSLLNAYLIAMKIFLEEENSKYIILADTYLFVSDYISYWKFTFESFVEKLLPDDWEICQLRFEYTHRNGADQIFSVSSKIHDTGSAFLCKRQTCQRLVNKFLGENNNVIMYPNVYNYSLNSLLSAETHMYSYFPCLFPPPQTGAMMLRLWQRSQQNEKITGGITESKKISFLFLLYDNIQKHDVWEAFFSLPSADPKKYSVYMHQKKKMSPQQKLISMYDIKETYRSAWGDYGIVNIQNRLLEHALKEDPYNHKFVFISDSHIPIYNFQTIYQEIMENTGGNRSGWHCHDHSFIEWTVPSKSDHAVRFHTIKNIHGWKQHQWLHQSQWCILNREQAVFLLEHEDEMRQIFGQSMVPDEHAYINMLRHYHSGKLLNNCDVVNKNITFVNWAEPSVRDIYRPYPKTYDQYELMNQNGALITQLRNKKYLFLRKVAGTCKININKLLTSGRD